MVSNIVDPVDESEQEVTETIGTENEGNTEEHKGAFEASNEDIVETADGESEVTEYELPTKFQGKSVEDIVGAYENLEKELGRKGQEIGELRKLSDDFLRQQVTDKQQTTAENEPVDFFDNPEAAVSKILENHPQLREMKEQQLSSTRTATQKSLETTHPDYLNIVQDGGFQDWVNESRFRKELFRQADSYDFDAADELISTWKERQMISKTKEVNADKEKKRQAGLKAGKTESRSSVESTAGKKIYRRADLIRLKQTDPSRYADLADEIVQAYSEGRVK
jgi:hypothetical protein